VSYKVSDALNVYAGYSQGWKAGSFDPRGANLVTPDVEKGFDPETLDSYEIGLKSNTLDGRARTNVAVFWSQYKDMQIPGSLGVDTNGDGVNDSFVGAVTNAAEASINGVELEGTYVLTDNLSADVALSLLDPKIKKWIVNGVDVSSQRVIQNTPKQMFNLGLTYNRQMSSGSLTISGNVSHKSKIVQFETPAPVIDQDAYSLVNASIVWTSETGEWSLGLHGRNLTNKAVKTAGYCFGSGGCPSTLGLEDDTTVFYGPPRTVTATVKYTMQ
ncbi:MAG TPA: TonB-dependent receptor, partial [Pseudomonadales bacterium]|nr:TonB-dependent receptor [Pseudomonadales bacterium]